MSIKYKTTSMNGKPIPTHKKVWILANGVPPVGYHIHHKNHNKFDNRIENLELMTCAEHTKHHFAEYYETHDVWNKGIEYGETEGYKKSNETRTRNHESACLETLKLYEENNGTVKSLAEKLGITTRQVYERVGQARNIRQRETGGRVLVESDGVSPTRHWF
jgi:hypothetical protein